MDGGFPDTNGFPVDYIHIMPGPTVMPHLLAGVAVSNNCVWNLRCSIHARWPLFALYMMYTFSEDNSKVLCFITNTWLIVAAHSRHITDY